MHSWSRPLAAFAQERSVRLSSCCCGAQLQQLLVEWCMFSCSETAEFQLVWNEIVFVGIEVRKLSLFHSTTAPQTSALLDIHYIASTECVPLLLFLVRFRLSSSVLSMSSPPFWLRMSLSSHCSGTSCCALAYIVDEKEIIKN